MDKGLAAANKPAGRESGMEILRIISIMLIVFHHFGVHGGFNFDAPGTMRFIVLALSLGGKIGVNIFVMISGYFLINSKFRVKKLLMFVFQVFFWSVTIFIFLCSFNLMKPDLRNVLNSFFPLTFNSYWFATTYAILYILSPFLNSFVKGISQKEHFRLLVILFVLWCVLASFTNKQLGLCDLGWFIFLYLTAAYIRLYPGIWCSRKYLNLLLGLASVGVLVLLVYIYDRFNFQPSLFFADRGTLAFWNLLLQNYLPVFTASLFIFITFTNIKIGCIKAINVVASATFGVYLIHDNQYLSPVLWQTWAKTQNYANTNVIVPYAIVTVLIIYAVCTVLDLMRQYLVEKPVFILYDRIYDKITAKKRTKQKG